MTDRSARLYEARSAYAGRFDADGRTLLFVSDLGGVPQAWALRPGARWPAVMLAPADRVQTIHPSPKRGLLAAGTDVGGDERTQLVIVRDGQATTLVDDPAHIFRFGAWSPDAKRLAYVSNTRDERWFDVYVHDLASGASSLVLQDDSTNEVEDWSSDGKRLLVRRVFSNSAQELWLVDAAGGEARLLTPRRAKYLDARFLPGGVAIVLRSDADRDVTVPALLPDDGGPPRALTATEVETDRLALSSDGALVAYATDRDGANEVFLRRLDGGAETRVEGLPRGALYEYWQAGLAFDPGGTRLAISWTGERDGREVWVHDVGKGRTRRATPVPRHGLSAARLAASEVVRYPSFDGRQIPALWYPPARKGAPPPPCVVLVHGGPESQFRPAWSPEVQHLAASGFAVLAPNVRGSTGYGNEYEHADDVRKRMDAVKDLAHAARWLGSTERADAARIAVWGGSYGGFMVLAAITTDPELWAAAVSFVGIANFVTFLEHTGAYRRHLREAEYGSLAKDREFLAEISPIKHVENVRAPLLLVHGANDPRVPIGETEQMAARLRELGRTVELIRFDDEGHQIAKLRNRLVAYPAAVAFLGKHLQSRKRADAPA